MGRDKASIRFDSDSENQHTMHSAFHTTRGKTDVGEGSPVKDPRRELAALRREIQPLEIDG
jgi:hypothetical protein